MLNNFKKKINLGRIELKLGEKEFQFMDKKPKKLWKFWVR